MSRTHASPSRRRNFSLPRSRAGQTLIGLLVALAIIAILAAIIIPPIAARHHQKGQALTPTERGYQAACGIYEAQINQAIMMYRQDHNSNPPSLDALKKYGLTDDMIHAPDCVFQYDPATGVAKNAAEGAQGVAGVVNPTSPEQLERGSQASQPAASTPNTSHSIMPPSATPATRGNTGASPGPRRGGSNLPGGLHMPNIGGGMGAGSDSDQ